MKFLSNAALYLKVVFVWRGCMAGVGPALVFWPPCDHIDGCRVSYGDVRDMMVGALLIDETVTARRRRDALSLRAFWRCVRQGVSVFVVFAGIVTVFVMNSGALRAQEQELDERRQVLIVRGRVASGHSKESDHPKESDSGKTALRPISPSMNNSFMADCRAAESGVADAAYRVARRYLFGVGVNRDRRMGVAWMRVAANRGHREAKRVTLLVPEMWGRLRPWCRPGGAPARAIVAPPAEILKIVHDMSPKYGLDPNLVLAVIQVESAYRTNAVSPKEAAGLMQLIPATAERFGVHNVFDPAENIRGGMKYLRWLLAYFQGDVTLALAGYNAGEGAVDRHGGVPPFTETQSYVRLIHGLYQHPTHPYDSSVVNPSPLVRR
ncbi:soluble lytic murein transglycosylase [Azospirillaceae bacterium]